MAKQYQYFKKLGKGTERKKLKILFAEMKSITYSNPVCLLLLVALLSPSFATQSCISTYPNGCHWHTSGGQIDYSFVFFLPKILALLLLDSFKKMLPFHDWKPRKPNESLEEKFKSKPLAGGGLCAACSGNQFMTSAKPTTDVTIMSLIWRRSSLFIIISQTQRLSRIIYKTVDTFFHTSAQ